MTDEQDPTPTDTPREPPPTLSAADAEALAALIEASFEAERVACHFRPRAERLAALLRLLDAGSVAGRELRIARVLRTIQARRAAAPDPELCSADAEALDAWVLAEFHAGRVPHSLRDRALAHEALAALIGTAAPVSSDSERSDLIARTLARVARATDAEGDSYRFVEPAARNRWADILSVAALLLIAVSILWPVLSSVRDSSRRALCGSNMRAVAQALGVYTGDHDDTLPIATAGFGGGTWWDVGRDPQHSNSANLYTLARERYLGLDEMACPGNPNAVTAPRSPDARDWPSLQGISYSYRVMARPEKELWGSPSQLVILADRSPVILRAVRGQLIFPGELSPNHGGRGQHALFADGTARWLDSPVLPTGDNIWLPKPIEMLIDLAAKTQGLDPIRGTEAPADRTDSFVGP